MGVGWAEGWLFCGTQGSTQLVPALRWSCRFEGCAPKRELLGSLAGIFEEKAVQPMETNDRPCSLELSEDLVMYWTYPGTHRHLVRFWLHKYQCFSMMGGSEEVYGHSV